MPGSSSPKQFSPASPLGRPLEFYDTPIGVSVSTPPSALWTPANLATPPDLWFDANASETIGKSSGSNVDYWTDKASGCKVAFGATKPVLTGNLLNGLPGLVFASGTSGGHGTTTKAVFTGDLSCFMVVTLTTINNFQVEIGAYIGGASGYPAFAWGQGTPQEHVALFRAGVAANYAPTGLLSVNTPAITEWTVPGLSGGNWPGTGTATSYMNGTSTGDFVAVTGYGAMTQTGVSIGDDSAVGNPLVGNRHEYIVLGHIATVAERQAIEGYLAWKWGLQAQLPAAHPFAQSAPVVPDQTGIDLTIQDDRPRAANYSVALASTTMPIMPPFVPVVVATPMLDWHVFDDLPLRADVIGAALKATTQPVQPRAPPPSVVLTPSNWIQNPDATLPDQKWGAS